uniref:Uncharacterized protein n=1 Tax=Sinocyclocheilus rhinocerous TaxID=307959 RepID=A0A673I940_9TELE
GDKCRKRKVDKENRRFKCEWTEQFCFILPDHHNAKPTCLLCTQTVAVCKADNVKCHFYALHSSFNCNYPEHTETCKQKVTQLVAAYMQSVAVIHKTTSIQGNASAASLRVARNLAKAMKPFTDAELIKNCAIDMEKVPLSYCTATRRVETLADECLSNLLSDIKKAEVMSLAIDSSYDQTDIEQLSVFVRFFDGKVFCEELLCLLAIQGHFFEKNGLNLSKVVSVVTDGALSMVGHHRDLISRLAAVNPALIAFHCIIHKSVLCAKLSGNMKETMDTVMRLVNYIHMSSGLQHRLFRALLEEMSAEQHNHLLHNDIQWLIKGRVLERVCELQNELCSFLSSLQSQKADTFLRFFERQHRDGMHKAALSTFATAWREDLLMRNFVLRLAKNFEEQFESFNLSSELLLFLRLLFSVPADGQWTAEAKRLVSTLDEASLQLEILEMSKSDLLREQNKEASVSDFWKKVVSQPKFKNSKIIAMFLLSMFPSTYICESLFSTMNIIKNQDRNCPVCILISVS